MKLKDSSKHNTNRRGDLEKDIEEPRSGLVNRQPLDGDYFTQEYLSEIQAEKRQNSENEFRYHSIKDDLKKIHQEKSRSHRQSNLLSDLLRQNYEEYYDLDKLDSIQAYDQFSDKEEMDTSSKITTSNKDEALEPLEEEKTDVSNRPSVFERMKQSVDKLRDASHQVTTSNKNKGHFLETIDAFKLKIKDFHKKKDSSESETVTQDDDESPLIVPQIEATNQGHQSLEKKIYYVRDKKKSKQAENVSKQLSATDIEVKTYQDQEAPLMDEACMTNIESQDSESFPDHVLQQTLEFREPILTDAMLNDVMVEEDITIDKRLHEDLQDKVDQDSLIKKDNFVSGAAWLSIGSIISRVIGALYVIPWAAWFGQGWTQANTLFSAGYKPYSLFLAIGTAGFPSAIAKQMAFYHSKKEYRVADKLFKNSLLVMLATGLISGLILYLFAPVLSEQSTNVNKEGAVQVLRSLVPPLLILPMMSLFRGYFQGFNDMKPSAVSQLVEQVARVIYMLSATYAIMVVMKGEITQAVVHSTFAAFIGAVVSMLYLIIIYIRRLPRIKELIESSEDKIQVDFKESLKIMALDSIPFIILGSGIIIMQLVDTYSFGQILEKTSILLLTEIDELYGVLSLDVDKLIMIIISLAIALSTAFVPSLTGTFAQKNIKATSQMVHHILNVFFIIMIPSAIGMAAIADNLYSFFYPLGSPLGPSLLITASLSSIVLGFYTVLSTILQSMNFRRHAVRFLIVGILVKILLQYPLVMLMQAHGAIVSTMMGLAVASFLMWIKLNRELTLNTYQIGIDFIKILIPALLMGISAMMWNRVFNSLFGPVGRLLTFVKVLLVVIIAVFIYFVLMAVQGMLSILIGDRYKDLQAKLRIRI